MIDKNTNFTAEWYSTYKVDLSSGNITVTLPDATEFTDASISFIGYGGDDMIFATVSSQTINTKTAFKSREGVTLVSDGANWFGYSGSNFLISPNGSVFILRINDLGIITTEAM